MKRIILATIATLSIAACADNRTDTPPTTSVVHRTTTSTSTTTTTTVVSAPATTTTTLPAPPVPTTTTVTVTVPAQPVTATGDDLRVPEGIRAAIHAHFDEFGVDVASQMTRIVWRESNGQPTAVNRSSGCYGLTQQALPLHADLYAAHGWAWQDSWSDVDRHLTVAADLYRGSGWRPWAL